MGSSVAGRVAALTLWEEQLGNGAPPFFTQGELKVNDEKPGNTAVFGSGGGVVMEFLSLKQAALVFNSGKGSHPA